MTQPDKELKAHDRRILLKSLRSETRPGGLKVSKTEENTIDLTYEAHPLCQEAAKMIEIQAAEIAELQARIAELEARSVVKPLEWDEDRPAKCWLAETAWGYYSVYFNGEYGWLCELDGHDDSWVKYPEEEYGFPLAEAAKAAAFKDYEKRILTALENINE